MIFLELVSIRKLPFRNIDKKGYDTIFKKRQIRFSGFAFLLFREFTIYVMEIWLLKPVLMAETVEKP